MKIAILSDLHIGYERFYDDAYAQAKEALFKAKDMADVLLIAGDVFDKRNPKPEVISQAINIFREVSRSKWKAKVSSFTPKSIGENEKKIYTDIPVIAISGTHERLAEGKDNALNMLGLAGLLVDTSEATTIVEKDGEKIAIFGLGGLSEERVREKLAELSPRPIENTFNIFLFHQSIYELLPFSQDFIKFEELPKGYDLYVDGHLHKFIEEKVHGKPFLIPGSTVLTQLKESEQENKGFIIFDTQSNHHEFVGIESRKFVSVKINSNEKSPTEIKAECEKEIEKVLSSSNGKPIIRLRIEGTISSDTKHEGISMIALQKKYQNKAYIEIDTSRMVDPGLENEIEEIREGKISDMSIKELGMSIFSQKLKESGFNGMDHVELFSIFSSEASKEKVLKEAEKVLLSKEE
jgi:DNA repair exonuclease SbcCD nuclease subunit